GKIIVDISVRGLGVHGEAGVLRHRKRHAAIAILNIDVTERRSAGDVHRAIAISDRYIARDAIERDVAAPRTDRKRSYRFAGREIGAIADIGLAVETAQLHFGAARVEFDGAGDMFEMSGSKEVPI